MSQHSQNEEKEEVQIVEQQDPEYDNDPQITRKHQQEVKQSVFSKLLQNNLSKFSKIFDGTSFAYTKLSLINKRLFSILPSISSYKHLRQITMEYNYLTEFDNLLYLRYLISLDLSNNKIEDIRSLDNANILPFLTDLNLSFNKIKRLVNLPLPRLKVLKLANNEIEEIQFEGNETLEFIDLNTNRLTNVSKLSKLPHLKQLILSSNIIQDITTLEQLPQLSTLIVDKNKVEKIENKLNLPKLYKLNLQENLISKIEDISGIGQNVTILDITTNPLSEELGDNVRKRVWMIYRHYTKINDADVEEDERFDWDKEYREEKEEEQRLKEEKEQQEREEREAAERAEAERLEEERLAKEAEERQRLEQEKQRLAEERRQREEEEKELEDKNVKQPQSQNKDQEQDD